MSKQIGNESKSTSELTYYCNVCCKKAGDSTIFCELCGHWIHRKCAKLTVAEFKRLGNSEEEWYCYTCKKEIFPFSNITDEELVETITNNSKELEDLYNYCINLNTDLINEYDEFNDSIDPDTNMFDILKSNYHMIEKVNANIQRHKDGLSVLHLNCRSVSAHFDEVRELLRSLENQVDIVCLSETWLTDTSCELFSLPNYIAYFSNRQNRKGGGSAIYVKESIERRKLDNLTTTIENCMESTSVEISSKCKGKIVVSSIYRSPNTNVTLFNEKIEYMLNQIGSKRSIICGDFNIDLLKNDSHTDTSTFSELLYSHGMFL